MKKYYLAYGSNLDVEQMKQRCPDATIVGKAVIKDWVLVFRHHADIIPRSCMEVPVLVWSISPSDERSLDNYEGFPDYYVKKDFNVIMTNLSGTSPREITAMAYVMREQGDLCIPNRYYFDGIRAGYERFGFDTYQLRLALQQAVEYSTNTNR